MKIYIDGLILKCDDIVPSEGSQNVKIQLIEKDTTYEDYSKSIIVSYLNGKKSTILNKIDGKYILPLAVFSQCGVIGLAVKLVNEDEILVTKQLVLKIDEAPNTNVLIPLEENWETIVKNYVNSILPNGREITNVPNQVPTSNPLNGKKITILGDSISAGYGANKSWSTYLSERTGAIVTNVAVTGSTISKVGSSVSVMDQLGNMPTPNNIDYIVIMGGGNDFLTNRQIGNINEWNDETLIGGFMRIFQIIYSNAPRVKVLVATDPPIYDSINDKSYEKYINATLEACNKFHIPCLNLWSVFGKTATVPSQKSIYWQDDNLHLTDAGQEYLSEIMEQYIKSGIENNNLNASSLNGYKLAILTQNAYDNLVNKDNMTIYITKNNKAYLGNQIILGGDSQDISDNDINSISDELWNTFFKMTRYGTNDVMNSNPRIAISGTATGSLIGNMSESNATYEYGAPVLNVAMVLQPGKSIVINFDYEGSNISTFNCGFYINGGQIHDMLTTNGISGNYSINYTNDTNADVNINGIGFMFTPPNYDGFTFELNVNSIEIN